LAVTSLLDRFGTILNIWPVIGQNWNILEQLKHTGHICYKGARSNMGGMQPCGWLPIVPNAEVG